MATTILIHAGATPPVSDAIRSAKKSTNIRTFAESIPLLNALSDVAIGL
jgi:hypothetical protein